MEDDKVVETKIQELDKQFDFVLIAEFFDESLVILTKMLCWELEEVRGHRETSCVLRFAT